MLPPESCCSGRIPDALTASPSMPAAAAAAGGSGGVLRGPMLPARSSAAFDEKMVNMMMCLRMRYLERDMLTYRLRQEADAEARKIESKKEFKRQVQIRHKTNRHMRSINGRAPSVPQCHCVLQLAASFKRDEPVAASQYRCPLPQTRCRCAHQHTR